ncbi:MotA/TolQ/ExbB proton channel family protein, partial [Acetobacter sp. DmW_136]
MTRLPRSFVSGLAAPALALLMSTAAPVAAFAQDAAPTAPAATAPAPDAAPSSAPAPAATPDATPAPAPAEQAPPAADTKEEANPYGLGALWSNGDIIARGVLLIMLIMSLGTWYIMITKFIEQA